MSTYAKVAIAGVAVIAIAFLGFNFLPNDGGSSGGAPAASPSAGSSSPPPSASPSPLSRTWPIAGLEPQRYHVANQGVPFSFAPPSARWRSLGTNPSGDAITTGVDRGSPEGPDFAWIVFTGIDDVATDPCAGQSAAVNGSSLDDLVAALQTIPGTSAGEPEDVTIGGLPGKLVTLRIDPDPPCPMNEFWLYGDTSLYPNSAKSIIRIWITEVDGTRWSVHTDQADVNPQNEQAIQQIIDSIQFE